MLFELKRNRFLDSLFCEPNKESYAIPLDLDVDMDLSWTSHKEDAKNMSDDMKNIKNDLRKSIRDYITTQNGKAKD